MLTPIEKINNNIFVKREDLSCLPPGPPFAKVRGIVPAFLELKSKGIQTVGYMETTISMAGWGVSYFAKKIGMNAVIYKPVYIDKKPRHNQIMQLQKWQENNAIIKPIQATRLQINWFQARNNLLKEFENAYMLPQGLSFKQTVLEVCKQVIVDVERIKIFKTIVVCLGSGVMMAGIIKGLNQTNLFLDLYGILVASKNKKKMKQKIYKMAEISNFGFFAFKGMVKIIDTGYKYTDKEVIKCPFPCNIYYDLKAWKWLMDNINSLKKPVLFWNIGA